MRGGRPRNRFARVMNSIAVLFAPLVLLLPSAAQMVGGEEARLTPFEAAESAVPAEPGWQRLETPNTVPVADQVRIERRVTIRISPRSPAPRRSLMAELAPMSVPSTMTERRMGKCVPVSGIAGVQTGQGSQLILYMRDQRVVSANLEKACSARDFYSGFYIERTSDGQICVDRDTLLSRSGANCKLTRIRQLIEPDE